MTKESLSCILLFDFSTANLHKIIEFHACEMKKRVKKGEVGVWCQRCRQAKCMKATSRALRFLPIKVFLSPNRKRLIIEYQRIDKRK